MVVGLTGGIASGKSTVLTWLAAQGCVTRCSDVLSREVVLPGEQAWQQIKDTFGEGFLLPDGTLNRSKMGELVFSDPQARQQLNSIVHPAVVARLQEAVDVYDPRTTLPLVLDIPLLFEAELQHLVQSIWLVWVPYQTQLARLMARNALTTEQAQQRLAAQMPLDAKAPLAHKVIDNSGSWEQTELQLQKLLQDT